MSDSPWLRHWHVVRIQDWRVFVSKTAIESMNKIDTGDVDVPRNEKLAPMMRKVVVSMIRDGTFSDNV
jgi:hypothetical protein